MERLSSNGQMVSQIDLRGVPHSAFDLRNHNFLSCKLGKIVASRVDEVYPGDRIKGYIQAVANFEPLAGPVMGSMVMKQESFYVPDSILWKNAHKFFTGKKGYKGHVPLVSPKDVADAYSLYLVLDGLHTDLYELYNRASDESDFENAVFSTFTDKFNDFLAFVQTYDAVDLIQPYKDILLKYFAIENSDGTIEPWNGSPLYSLLTSFVDSTTPEGKETYELEEWQKFIDSFCDMLYEIMEFFFGVSTHLDYMGWPVMDNWRDYFFYETKSIVRGEEIVEVNAYNDPNSFRGVASMSNAGSFPVRFSELFSEIGLNWLPFRAAYAVWYWNYRDELLEVNAFDPESDDFLSDSVSSEEIILLTLLRVRCWYKDTYTTALTNTGDGNFVVPITDSTVGYKYYDAQDTLIDTTDASAAVAAGATMFGLSIGGVDYRIPMNYLTDALADLQSSSPSSINANFLSIDLFDRIKRLRNFVQKKLILGYEYDDVLWSSFMVKLSNVRMRIPELLGSGRDSVDMNTIVNNTTTTEQIAGDKTAVAWAQGRTSDINYFAEEHGWFISFVTILPIQSYLGGLQRFYMKHEQFDMMWPEFATMGMDAVYNYELSAPRGAYSAAGLSDETSLGVFGYQGRYFDLKSRHDESHGRLRTDLRYMTFSREFNEYNAPKLNYIFVHCWPRTDMFVVDDPSVDVVRTLDVYHALDFERRLPVPSEFV